MLPLASIRADMEDHPVEDAKKFKLSPAANRTLPTIWLVGDSTMRVGTPGQRGWGDELAPYFQLTRVNVVNQAIGGRSSRTYQSEGRWAALLPMIQKGDTVIIQFGHNDAGALNDTSRARGSIKGIGDKNQEIDNMLTHQKEVVHTFGWYLQKYILDTKARGATPIVFSLVPRNSWKEGKVARSTPNNYGEWAKQIAKESNCSFVDHNDLIATKLEKLGQEAVKPFFSDGLHATSEGAKLNARMAVVGLKALPGNPFGSYLSPEGQSVNPV